MLPGFKIMLSGFKNMLYGLKLPDLSCVLSVPMTRNHLYFDAQIGAITRTAPFQTLLGVGSCQTATTRRQLCVAAQCPWWLERPSLSFGLQVLRRFQASSGPLGGIEALLESTFESQGDITWKNQCLRDPDQAEEAPRTSVPLHLEI